MLAGCCVENLGVEYPRVVSEAETRGWCTSMPDYMEPTHVSVSGEVQIDPKIEKASLELVEILDGGKTRTVILQLVVRRIREGKRGAESWVDVSWEYDAACGDYRDYNRAVVVLPGAGAVVLEFKYD